MNYTLSFFVVLLFCGLVVDVGNAEWQARNVQIAADAAAQGANLALQSGSTSWVAAGQADAASNGFTNGSNGVTVSIVSPPTSGAFSGVSGAVQALVSKTTSPIFLRIFQLTGPTVSASAVAKSAASTSCFYILDSSMSGALSLSGAFTITNGCGIFVNSSSASAMQLSGAGTVTASAIDVVGNYSKAGAVTLSPTPTTGATAVTDPLASITAPVFSSCTYTNWSFSGAGSVTLSPGTYCGGITISGAATVTINPGLYIITGGINWSGALNITGTGVTFYLTKGGGSSYGTMTVAGSVNCSLTAPTSTANGGIPGVLFFGDRSWDDTSANVDFNGAASTKIEGIFYFPTTGINISGAVACNGNYLGVVADNFTMSGAISWTAPAPNYSALAGGNPFKGKGGGLVQ